MPKENLYIPLLLFIVLAHLLLGIYNFALALLFLFLFFHVVVEINRDSLSDTYLRLPYFPNVY